METTNKFSLIKKILIALGGILSCACVGFGVFHQVYNSSIEVHAENEVHRKKYNQKVTYNDTYYIITLNAEETTYTFDNLNTYLLGQYNDSVDINDIMSDVYFTFDVNEGAEDLSLDEITNEGETIYLNYVNSYVGSVSFTNKSFTAYNTEDDNLTGTSPIELHTNSTYYSALKSVIELDIQANSVVPTPSYVLYPINANNDTFTYLSTQITTFGSSNVATQLANSYVVYRGVTYNFLNASNGSLTWQDSVSKDSINFGFQTHNDYPVNKFFYFNFTDTEVETFADIVYFYDAEFIADNITAPMNTGNFITDLIALLTGGITGTSTAMGVGLSSLVDALAIQNNAMSPFMSVIFAFGGIALALALCRWIVNLLSSLGQRNR